MGYPAPPGERLAYDKDGTIGFLMRNVGSDPTPFEMGPAALSGLNSDVSKGLWVPGSYWTYDIRPMRMVLMFPTATRLRGLYHANCMVRTGGVVTYSTSGVLRVLFETSQDTTNGVDGTWNTLLASYQGSRYDAGGSPDVGYQSAVGPTGLNDQALVRSVYYRLPVNEERRKSVAETGVGWAEVAGSAARQVKGLRISYLSIDDNGWSNSSGQGQNDQGVLNYLHLYGEPDTEAVEHRLSFVSTDGVSPIDFDWGDVYAGEVAVKQFKVKNLSGSLTATGIDVSSSPSSPSTTPAPHLAMEYSTNGVTFSGSLSISSIAPGATSATLYVRATIPSGLRGPWSPQMLAEVGGWS